MTDRNQRPGAGPRPQWPQQPDSGGLLLECACDKVASWNESGEISDGQTGKES